MCMLAKSFEISIHAPREGSDPVIPEQTVRAEISIHAPREGSDPVVTSNLRNMSTISIHAPREGSDVVQPALETLTARFLSTLPARGATPGS